MQIAAPKLTHSAFFSLQYPFVIRFPCRNVPPARQGRRVRKECAGETITAEPKELRRTARRVRR